MSRGFTAARNGTSGHAAEPASETGRIEIGQVNKTFIPRRGTEAIEALRDVSVDVRPGELVSLVGPSGCGKSTLLKMVAGLLEPSSGRIAVDGVAVKSPRRSVGMMFQTPELFPWRTVLKNVLLPIEIFGHDKDFHRKRALELLELVGLQEFQSALPRELSGGMQQRVALCRVLVSDPSVVLMDEPFGALDEFSRERLNVELLRIWDATRKTILFVTHNINEAVFLADRVVVMAARPGRVLSVIDVPLGRAQPRTQQAMRDPAFTDTVFEVRGLLGL
ncbi:MAG TPA: ABC transporter ATP-binding protein [Actinomycetes bacterium]|nr:ABC transporter ATP-binding protein [Actinomycetes bacterium]